MTGVHQRVGNGGRGGRKIGGNRRRLHDKGVGRARLCTPVREAHVTVRLLLLLLLLLLLHSGCRRGGRGGGEHGLTLVLVVVLLLVVVLVLVLVVVVALLPQLLLLGCAHQCSPPAPPALFAADAVVR